MDALNSDNNTERSNELNAEEAVEKLCQLAATYRGYRARSDKQAIIVTEYMKLFNQLYEDGTLPFLDFECLLPDQYLPIEYVRGLGLSSESAYRRI